MRSFVLALIVAAFPLFSMADEIPNPDIEGVISSQIEAFAEDDVDLAFSLASPIIQGIFITPERFGRMVESGFPMVWRAGEVRFLGLRKIDGRLFQKVMVVGPEGGLHFLDYEMQATGTSWQINSVQLLRAPSVGA